jgi:cytochrome c oxidase cbb3-type subunit 3/ubiquinol-cytochrome c reductase cytochrome c subunit
MLACKREPRPSPARSAPSTPASAPAMPSTLASARRGAELYGRMCAVCHGARGEGYRADGAPALAQPDFLASVSDEFLEFAIAIGRAGTPMSAWRRDQGGPLSAGDVLDVIAFIRTWQGPTAAVLEESSTAGDEARGKALFEKTCERCHVPKGASVHILKRQWLIHAKPAFIRYAIAKGRPPTPMVGFADTLGKAGIEDIVVYMRSLPSWPAPGEVQGSSKPPPIPLGPVPLHRGGPEPVGFRAFPDLTPVKTVWAQHARKARLAFLDARTPSDYTTLHIEGAVSVPFYDPSPYLDALPRDAWLVCYCSCPYAESAALARQLQQAGFTKVTVLTEGLPGWTSAHHPTREGISP